MRVKEGPVRLRRTRQALTGPAQAARPAVLRTRGGGHAHGAASACLWGGPPYGFL